MLLAQLSERRPVLLSQREAFKCTQCDRTFLSSRGMRVHRFHHHRAMLQIEKAAKAAAARAANLNKPRQKRRRGKRWNMYAVPKKSTLAALSAAASAAVVLDDDMDEGDAGDGGDYGGWEDGAHVEAEALLEPEPEPELEPEPEPVPEPVPQPRYMPARVTAPPPPLLPSRNSTWRQRRPWFGLDLPPRASWNSQAVLIGDIIVHEHLTLSEAVDNAAPPPNTHHVLEEYDTPKPTRKRKANVVVEEPSVPQTSHADLTFVRFGQELVGMTVEVFQPNPHGPGFFKRGVVTGYVPRRLLHRIRYDDGNTDNRGLNSENARLPAVGVGAVTLPMTAFHFDGITAEPEVAEPPQAIVRSDSVDADGLVSPAGIAVDDPALAALTRLLQKHAQPEPSADGAQQRSTTPALPAASVSPPRMTPPKQPKAQPKPAQQKLVATPGNSDGGDAADDGGGGAAGHESDEQAKPKRKLAFHCTGCGEVLNNVGSFKAHRKRCPALLSAMQERPERQSQQSAAPSGDGKFPCIYCNRMFDTEPRMTTHEGHCPVWKLCASASQETRQCMYCDNGFSSFPELSAHLKTCIRRLKKAFGEDYDPRTAGAGGECPMCLHLDVALDVLVTSVMMPLLCCVLTALPDSSAASKQGDAGGAPGSPLLPPLSFVNHPRKAKEAAIEAVRATLSSLSPHSLPASPPPSAAHQVQRGPPRGLPVIPSIAPDPDDEDEIGDPDDSEPAGAAATPAVAEEKQGNDPDELYIVDCILGRRRDARVSDGRCMTVDILSIC